MRGPEAFQVSLGNRQFPKLQNPDADSRSLRVRDRPALEVWPESHRPGFTLRQADVLQSYTA